VLELPTFTLRRRGLVGKGAPSPSSGRLTREGNIGRVGERGTRGTSDITGRGKLVAGGFVIELLLGASAGCTKGTGEKQNRSTNDHEKKIGCSLDKNENAGIKRLRQNARKVPSRHVSLNKNKKEIYI